MATRAGDFFHRHHTARRRNSFRQPLTVIPTSDVARLSISLGPTASGMNRIHGNVARSFFRPTVSSPDELVIQKRGRRSKPIIWSPDASAKRNSLLNYSQRDRTPDRMDTDVESPISPIGRKISVKKKLDLSEKFGEEQLVTPEKEKSVEKTELAGSSLENGLRMLSKDQLVEVIMDLISMQKKGVITLNNQLYDVVSTIVPTVPDIYDQQRSLNNLRESIYNSLNQPNDNETQMLAADYLKTFHTMLVEQARKLLESQCWASLMQYVIFAWAHTKDFRTWGDQNNITQRCFSSLANFCKQALLKGNFDKSTLNLYSQKIEQMVLDCDDMKICLHMVNEMIQ